MNSSPRRSALILAVGGLLLSFPEARGNPSGEIVRHGQVQFERGNGALRILQSSDRAIIDWNSFSIANGETTRFVQPGQESAVLNRVSGGSASLLNGALRANGNVFLLNPNGIVIGPTGTIDAGGFVASTLDVSDADFLSGGDLEFRGGSQNGVVNLGRIDAAGGDVFLIAATVRNAGSISADSGTVGLAAGNNVLLKASGDERVFVRGASGGMKENGVLNEGTVRANVAELKAHGGNVYGMAVNNKGRVAATGISREGGQIFLRAGGSRRARIRNTGTLQASSAKGNGGRITVDAGSEESTVENAGTVDVVGGSGTGGEIVVLGSRIQLDTNSLVIADGETGGGSILIGGDERGQNVAFSNATDIAVEDGASISANAIGNGDGGRVILFAENRVGFFGQVSAEGGTLGGDGGFVEISGKNEVVIPDLSSRVKLSATNGKGGTLLFDPNDILIIDGPITGDIPGSPTNANTLNDGDINDFLTNSGSLIIETNPTPTTGNGDIRVNGGVNILWNTSNSLTFNATQAFNLAGGTDAGVIRSLGAGDLVVNAGGRIGIFSGAVVEVTNGDLSLNAGTTFRVFADADIITANGDIAINANTAGTNTANAIGFNMVSGEIITNGSGNIMINAQGGGDVATQDNMGVFIGGRILSNSTNENAGSINITGTGGANGTGGGVGIRLETAGARISSMGGDIVLVGIGQGGGNDNVGTSLSDGQVASFGGGNVDISGTGGVGTNSHGTEVLTGVRSFGTGNVSIFGDAGPDASSLGFEFANASEVTATTGDITILTDSINLNSSGNIQSSGNLFLTPSDPTLAINLVDIAPDANNLQISSAEFSNIADGFSSITIGDSVGGSGLITVDNRTFTDPVTFTSSGSMGEIAIVGPLIGTGNAAFKLDAGSRIILSDSIRTAGGELSIIGPVVLQNDVVIDSTTMGAVATGADVTFQNAITGDGSLRNFSIRAGTEGDIQLLGDVGAGNLIEDVNLGGRRIAISNSVVSQTNAQIIADRNFVLAAAGSVTAGNAISITANTAGNTGSFNGIDISGALEATNGGLSLNGTSGDDPGDVAVNVTGTGSLRADGDLEVTAANQTSNQTAVRMNGSLTSFSEVTIESGLGDIEIDGPVSSSGSVELTGMGASDYDFIIRSGVDTSDLVVSGGTGSNTLDFSGFTDGPVVLGVDQLTNIGSIVGSGNSGDSLALGDVENFITVGADNSGTVNGDFEFTAFENINGGNDDDTFNFNGLFTFSGQINGGMGNDALNIDTANGATANDAEIVEGRISINPVWNFSGFEAISLQMGGGDDTVTSQFTSFSQNLDGGAGTDLLVFSEADPGAASPLTESGSGTVSFTNFETFSFGPGRSPSSFPAGPQTPFPATQPDSFSGSNEPGSVLQIQVNNDNPEPTAIGNQGVVTFAASTGVVGGGGGGLGGIESSIAAFSAFAQQGIILVGLDSSPLYVPMSLDGQGGEPSGPGALSLLNALSPESNVELLEALGLDLGIYLVDPDGPFAIDLSGRPQAAATLQNLLSQLSPNAMAEVQNAIEMAVSVPLVPVDGPIRIGLENPPLPQAIVILFNQEVGADALAELNAALGR